MSHFTVMIIGENPEAQLEPYNENTVVEEYECEPMSEESKNDMMEYYRGRGEFKNFDECYEKFGERWDGNSHRKKEDGTWTRYSTYNPNSKWDWYVLGGRWSGAILKLKDGATGLCGEPGAGNNPVGIDQARKGDIDFDRIYREARQKAIETYREVKEKMGGEIPTMEHTWESLFEGEYAKLTPEERREIYGAQNCVKLFREKISDHPFGLQLEEFQCTENEYADRAESAALSTYAMIKDSIWYQKGEMGWFGISTGEMPQHEWDAKVKEMLESLPDDTLISIYDCHI